jgi:prevent-host-death family protein
MRSIGIRELRQRASDCLREVERGDSIEVTDRGRPVALLVPIPRAGTLEALAAAGRLTPATRDPRELDEPLEPLPGMPLPSEVLAEMRADER